MKKSILIAAAGFGLLALASPALAHTGEEAHVHGFASTISVGGLLTLTLGLIALGLLAAFALKRIAKPRRRGATRVIGG
ncbi:MAG: hypothetical protein MRY63_14665 [Neomegalonema sp.]|nr:hypothetical protein [Neomegalonema sp.]